MCKQSFIANANLLTRIKLLIVHKKKINIQNWYLNFKGARDILTSLTHEVSALKSNYALCENANIFAANQLTRIQFMVCCTSLLQISLLGNTCMLLCCSVKLYVIFLSYLKVQKCGILLWNYHMEYLWFAWIYSKDDQQIKGKRFFFAFWKLKLYCFIYWENL